MVTSLVLHADANTPVQYQQQQCHRMDRLKIRQRFMSH